MVNRIRGITVEINGNTTGLNKALEDVNKNIKNTQIQLKDVEKLLKHDPTNTELLSQKQRLLADAVSSTSDKLETLKKASEQAAKTKDNYDAWKAKYDPIKQKIGETETKLHNLKEQSKTADEQLSKGEIFQEKYDALQREIVETQQELKLAMPPKLNAADIDIRPGAAWIPVKYIQQFMEETFKTPDKLKPSHNVGFRKFIRTTSIEVKFSEHTAAWNISNKSADKGNVVAGTKFGTEKRNGYQLFEDILNLRDTKITKKIITPDGKEKSVLDEKASAAARQKQKAIKQAFSVRRFIIFDASCILWIIALRSSPCDFWNLLSSVSIIPVRRIFSELFLRELYRSIRLTICSFT